MKIVDFINKLNKFGYTEDTELSFGFLNGEQGEYYECEVMSVDDDDRQCGYDDIIVEFKKPEAYIKSEIECMTFDLREKIASVINEYLS